VFHVGRNGIGFALAMETSVVFVTGLRITFVISIHTFIKEVDVVPFSVHLKLRSESKCE